MSMSVFVHQGLMNIYRFPPVSSELVSASVMANDDVSSSLSSGLSEVFPATNLFTFLSVSMLSKYVSILFLSMLVQALCNLDTWLIWSIYLSR